MKIYYLEITSWNGISAGATHYYGKIKDGGDYNLNESPEDIILNFKLDKYSVEKLNKKEEFLYAKDFRSHYKIGDISKRFDSEEDVKLAAIKYFNENLSNDKAILIHGRSSVYEAQEILIHNLANKKQVSIIKKINKLAVENDKLDYDKSIKEKKRKTKINNSWEILWNNLTKK